VNDLSTWLDKVWDRYTWRHTRNSPVDAHILQEATRRYNQQTEKFRAAVRAANICHSCTPNTSLSRRFEHQRDVEETRLLDARAYYNRVHGSYVQYAEDIRD